MSRLPLLICVLLGCGTGAPSSADLASRDSGSSTCQSRVDCRLYSSYCVTAPCQCIALGANDVDPPCVGGQMSCLIDPCSGKSAACTNGVCAVSP